MGLDGVGRDGVDGVGLDFADGVGESFVLFAWFLCFFVLLVELELEAMDDLKKMRRTKSHCSDEIDN